MLKRILSLLLLFAIICNMTGYYIVFKAEQSRIRRSIKTQIKKGVPENELHYFSLSQDEYDNLHWERTDKEFRSVNTMYDIVRIEKTSDSIHLYCINDSEETVLFAKLDDLIKKKMERESGKANSPVSKVIKAMKTVFIPDAFIDYAISMESIHSFDSNTSRSFYSAPFIEILTPPPGTV